MCIEWEILQGELHCIKSITLTWILTHIWGEITFLFVCFTCSLTKNHMAVESSFSWIPEKGKGEILWDVNWYTLLEIKYVGKCIFLD